MSDELPRTEWHNAPDFAEVAEALGVTTAQIMAAQNPTSSSVLVLYTPTEGTEDIYAARLERDADGVLVLFGEPRELPGLWEEIKRSIEDVE